MHLVARVWGILSNPKAEWPQIEREPGSFVSLFKNYVGIVAAISALSKSIVIWWLYSSDPGAMDFPERLFWAAVLYGAAVAGMFIEAYIIYFFAGVFGAQRDFENAVRISAYSPTAAWVTGAFLEIPYLRILGFVGNAYSIYLLHTGIVALMRPPKRRLVYTATILICLLAVWLATILLLSFFSGEDLL